MSVSVLLGCYTFFQQLKAGSCKSDSHFRMYRKKYNQNLSTELRCGVHVFVCVCVSVAGISHQKIKREFRKMHCFGILRAVDW